MSKILLNSLILLAIIITAAVPSLAANVPRDDDAMRYDIAIEQIRAGKIDEALPTLDELATKYPGNPTYLYDLVTALSWAERDAEAVQGAALIDFTAAPAYVLEAIGKSARNLQRYPLAIDAYTTSFAKDPSRVPSSIGLAYALIETDNTSAAIAFLRERTNSDPKNTAYLEAMAFAYKAIPDYFALLDTYEKILEISPDNHEALKGRVWAASWLGAAPIAYRLAQQQAELFTTEEMLRLAADNTGMSVRFAALESQTPQARAQALRAARSELIERIRYLQNAKQSKTPIYVQTLNDLIIVSVLLGQSQDVIDVYQQLVITNNKVTPYTKNLVAENYLRTHEPAMAEELYRQIITENRDYLAAYLGLFYALVDQDKHDEAGEVLQQAKTVFSTSPYRRALSDSQRVSLDIAVIQHSSFTDQLEVADQSLTYLTELAPANADIRTELATLQSWRGWPRLALNNYNIALAHDGHHLGALLGKAQTLVDSNDLENAELLQRELEDAYPDNHRVDELATKLEIAKMWDLRLNAGYGRSSSPNDNLAAISVDGRLYSPPFNYRYRAFAHGWAASTNLPGDQRYTIVRNGLGIDYRSPHWRLAGELHAALRHALTPGFTGNATWLYDDFWTFDAELETVSQSVPLRAQQTGITGWQVGSGGTHRWNELTSVGAGARIAGYSDNNQRLSENAFAIHRLLNYVTYKFDARLDAYMSQNKAVEANYFNPSSDISVSVSGINEHILYRHYQHSFRHRLQLNLGAYKQAGYDTMPVWSLRYEHQWNPVPRFELMYGFAYGQPVYDGNSETSWQLFAGLSGRF